MGEPGSAGENFRDAHSTPRCSSSHSSDISQFLALVLWILKGEKYLSLRFKYQKCKLFWCCCFLLKWALLRNKVYVQPGANKSVNKWEFILLLLIIKVKCHFNLKRRKDRTKVSVSCWVWVLSDFVAWEVLKSFHFFWWVNYIDADCDGILSYVWLPVIPRIVHGAIEASWYFRRRDVPTCSCCSWSHRPKKKFCYVQMYSFLHLLSAVLQEMQSGVAPLLLLVYLPLE